MADWRQIQARIRKAKASTTPADQLADLYQRTRDAMVAFELARWQEKAGDNVEAAKWYTAAAERFRRSQWRVKAEEALTRLGAPIPAPIAPDGPVAGESSSSTKAETASDSSESSIPAETKSLESFTLKTDADDVALDETDQKDEIEVDGDAQPAELNAAAGATPSAAGASPVKKHRRRGRRGGRNRRRDGQVGGQPATGTAAGAASGTVGSGASGGTGRREPVRQFSGRSEHAGSASSVSSVPSHRPAPTPVEPVAEMPRRNFESREGGGEADAVRQSAGGAAAAETFVGRMRTGEPALASKISQLESRLRRLLACPMASLEDADQAPAGPGVLLLSDSDQVTHYYIEECQTLRIGVGNLLRGSRGSKDWGQLKQRMAENLGIPEARVSKYLKDNCGVRWLQLDEGAPQLAHFAIAVLRPVVNE